MRFTGRNIFSGGKEMDVTIIRHFPTDWNESGFLQGKRDIPISLPLTKQNQAKMEENKQKLQQLQPFDDVLVSQLIRTHQTAKIYGYTDVKVEPLLDELDFGLFEGKKREELNRIYDEWAVSPLTLTLGEPLVRFQERIFEFLNKYAHKRSLLLFGHGSWARALTSIEKVGSIQMMNQFEIKNNELITLHINV